MRKHWLSEGKLELFKKLIFKTLPPSSSAIFTNDEFVKANLPYFQQVSLDKSADLIVYNPGEDSPDLMEICRISRPGGIILLNLQSRNERKKLNEYTTALREEGFEIDIVIYYGFFVYIFTWVFRMMGVALDEKKPPMPPVNMFLKILLKAELIFHPYLHFVKGESMIVLARHMIPYPPQKYDLSVVIPAYNERKRIVPFLKRVETFFKEKQIDFEIIVVDDGSKDNTSEVISEAMKDVRVVKLYKNFGKGGAIKEGIRLSSGQKILISDADGSTPIEEFSLLDAWLDRGADIAIGSRYMAQSNIITKQPLIRRIISRAGNLLIRFLLGLPFRDTQCGFKLFHRIPAQNLFRGLHNLRFGFDFEILKKASVEKLSVVEVPVKWSDASGSKVTVKETFRTLMDLVYLRFGKFILFSLIGIMNTGIDFAVHNFLIMSFGMGDSFRQSLYQTAGFICANIFSYFLNSGITFHRHGSYAQFLIVSVLTMLVTTFSYYGLNELFNPYNDLLMANLLKLNSIAVSMIGNYFGYKFIVFKSVD